MESMSDIVWSIKPENDTLEDTIVHMREFASELCEPLGIALEFQFPQIEKMTLSPDARRNIFLIFKEAVNNAAKYSSCKNIITSFKISEDDLIMMIKDDGAGFDTALIKNGNGLRNMQTRAAHLQAQLSINTAINSGTTITLCYPHFGVKKN